MALNPYFLQGSSTEQNLVQSLINEQIKMYGVEVYYIPRRYMTKTYLEDINFLLTTQKQIRFNKRQDRLYLDLDFGSLSVGDYLVIDCFTLLDPSSYPRVWNDSFLKPYTVALIKRQWGQNMSKFQGVKLPGGIELNGREMYEDAEKELTRIREIMSNTYELPPLDMIG